MFSSLKKMKESGVLSNIWSKYKLQKAEVMFGLELDRPDLI